MRLLVLARGELLKSRRRPGLWVAYLSFVAIVAIALGGQYYRALNHPDVTFALPEDWRQITGLAPLAGFFAAVAIILTTASEFVWNTARQQVIDGLSKEEWFAGKLLTALGLVAAFAVTLLAVGFALGVGGPGAVAGEPWAGPTERWMLGGALLLSLGYGALAFLVALLTRRPGGAMGLFFLWGAILEQLLRGALDQAGGWAASLGRALPVTVFNGLVSMAQYDLAIRAESASRFVAAGREAPGYWPTPGLWGLAVAWVILFVAGAFWTQRARDL